MPHVCQRQDPGYLEVLEKLTLAWAEQRKVQVWHRSETAGIVLEYLLSPCIARGFVQNTGVQGSTVHSTEFSVR